MPSFPMNGTSEQFFHTEDQATTPLLMDVINGKLDGAGVERYTIRINSKQGSRINPWLHFANFENKQHRKGYIF